MFDPGTAIIQAKVTFEDIAPPIWRQLLLPPTLNLAELHHVIQAAFGWLDYHLMESSLCLAVSPKGASLGVRHVAQWWDPPMKIVRLTARQGPKALFLVAFGFLCVLVGIASVHFQFFPYPLVRDAWQGAQAARHMLLGAGDEEWAAGSVVKRRFERAGVTRYNSARALDGLTLYTSWHVPEVVLINMTGDVVRRWHLPFSEVLAPSQSDRAAVPDDEVIVRQARLLPDGDLVAVYERPNQTPYGWGLARFN